LREEHGSRLFQNRLLRRIFGLTGDEVMGGWIELYTEELQDLYPSPSIIRINYQVEEDKMGGACCTDGGEEERIYVISWKARGTQNTRKTKT
jgi:hypothetical protein